MKAGKLVHLAFNIKIHCRDDIDLNILQIDQFIDLVSKCGKSKVYKTRELAARALVPLLTDENILSIANNLIESMTTNDIPLNLLHGYSLQVKSL